MPTNVTGLDFFSGQRVTQLAAAALVKGGVPRKLPPALWTVGPTKPYSDKVQWANVTFSRGAATVINRGSVPRAVNMGNSAWEYSTLLNMAEEMTVDDEFLGALSSDMAMVRNNAMLEMNRRMISFNRRFETARTNMVNSLFALGKIYVGTDGGFLASSSGAYITIDPGIPTAHKLTLDGAGSTYNIGDWSNPATDIGQNLRALQDFSIRANNYELSEIIYGETIPSYLYKNKALAPYFARNPSFNEFIKANNEIPNGTLGFNWTPARMSYMTVTSPVVDGAGTETTTAIFPTNYLGIMPPITDDWYEFIEGGTRVPQGVMGAQQIAMSTDLVTMNNSYFMTAYGKYGYGYIRAVPAGISMIQGDCCGPIIKVPGVFYFGTCS